MKSVSLISRRFVRASCDRQFVYFAQNIQNIAASGKVHFWRISAKRPSMALACFVKTSVQTFAQSLYRFGFSMKNRMSPLRNRISAPEISEAASDFVMSFMR